MTDSPENFLADVTDEQGRPEPYWRAEFSRGEWAIGEESGAVVGLLGRTAEDGAPDRHYLEYLWVAPQWRRRGIALSLIEYALTRLRVAGICVAYLRVLDGNEAAVKLYERTGFRSEHHSHPIDGRPGRAEARMYIKLT